MDSIKIVVISDSHRDTEAIESIKGEMLGADYVYFLGDGYNDFGDIESEIYPKLIKITGNCDRLVINRCDLSILKIGEHRIYATHGFNEGVKSSFGLLKHSARKNNCDVALFGHTHRKYVEKDGDLLIVNPGSINRDSGGTYCFLTFQDEKIEYIFKSIDNFN